MAQNDEALTKIAADLIKAGRKNEARHILEDIVEQNDQNEQAWLWLSACVETLEEQQLCLENVLALNPSNVKAQRGLAAINTKLGQPNTSTSAAPITPAPSPISSDEPSPPSASGFGDDVYGRRPSSMGTSPSSSSANNYQADPYGFGLPASESSNDAFTTSMADAAYTPFESGEPFGDTSFSSEGDSDYSEHNSIADLFASDSTTTDEVIDFSSPSTRSTPQDEQGLDSRLDEFLLRSLPAKADSKGTSADRFQFSARDAKSSTTPLETASTPYRREISELGNSSSLFEREQFIDEDVDNLFDDLSTFSAPQASLKASTYAPAAVDNSSFDDLEPSSNVFDGLSGGIPLDHAFSGLGGAQRTVFSAIPQEIQASVTNPRQLRMIIVLLVLNLISLLILWQIALPRLQNR